MLIKRNYILLIMLATLISFTSCSDDDDGETANSQTTGSIEVENQNLVDGTITIAAVEISEPGWLVIHRDNVGLPSTEVVGYSFVDEGNTENIIVDLGDTQIFDGEPLWASLHSDDGDGVFEWDGTTGADIEIMDGDTAVYFVVGIPDEENAED